MEQQSNESDAFFKARWENRGRLCCGGCVVDDAGYRVRADRALPRQAGGKGQDGLAPPLTEYPGKYSTTAPGRAQLTSTLVHGMFGEIKVHDKSYNFKMPSFASASDEDLAQVLNYVVFDLNAQHGDAKPFTAADIKAARAQTMDSAAVHTQRAVVTKGLGL